MEKSIILSYKPFSSANGATAERLLSQSSLHSLKGGDEIKCEKALGLVVSGEITVRGLNGGRRMIYRTIPKGEVFGAARIFGGDGAYTVMTAKKTCEIALIPEHAVREATANDGGFAVALAEILCEKLRILNRKLSTLSAPDSTAALCKALLDASKNEGDRIGIGSRTELAARLGISRMTLYRIFDSLERNGAVIIGEKDVIIKDKEILKSLI